MPRVYLAFVILVLVQCLAGCGVARTGELCLLAADTAPPEARCTDTRVRTLYFLTTPRIDTTYAAPWPKDELVRYYQEHLAAAGWTARAEQPLPGVSNEYSTLVFEKPQAHLELALETKTASDTTGDGYTEVFVRITTHHFWDGWGLDWIQGLIWAATGFSDNPTVEAVVQLF